MEPSLGTPQKPSTHPAIIAAGVAVVLFCAVGTAAIMGWIPLPTGGKDAVPPTPVAASAPVKSSAARSTQQASATPARQIEGTTQSTHAATIPATALCANCGVVESIRQFSTRGEGSGLGAAGGAVVGGLLGNQVGGGRGQDVMTVVGAIGGAVAGNQIEGRVKTTQGYEIAVRLNDGSLRTVQQTAVPEWRPGERVRIVDGVVKSNA
ncbi:glycine zipper 2TM domain-containing protein [Lacisediminimonas profundi]|uniref:glycine zipper 2TM domain-containing protein n=1 Tax=Lacisediminimonas profundi TaxID=2603856 RepID=UPI00124B5085|nr:glycine zipper 2TM domain-containing protein [Lacisediminimonas profundi]